MLGEALWARSIASTSVNRTVVERDVVRKTRRLDAGVTIAAGNVFFALAGASFRMFVRTEAWAARERAAFRALHGVEVAGEGRTLVFPRLPGVDLATRAPDARALVAVGRCLREAHARDGFTHGDAHLGNYLYDENEGRCRLIDFDAEHVASLSGDARRDDDVAVLVLDLIGRRGVDEATRLCAAFFEGYQPDARCVDAVCESLEVPSGLAGVLMLSRAHGLSREALARGFDAVRGVLRAR